MPQLLVTGSHDYGFDRYFHYLPYTMAVLFQDDLEPLLGLELGEIGVRLGIAVRTRTLLIVRASPEGPIFESLRRQR